MNQGLTNFLNGCRAAVRTGSSGYMEPVDCWKSLTKYHHIFNRFYYTGTRGLKP